MRHTNSAWVSFGGAAALLGGLACGSPSDTAPADIVSSQWQHHKVRFNYAGFTTLYTCDGLESHARQILLHLGARKDVNVTAVGCPGPNTPSHTAWVETDFYALAPAVDVSESDRVQAHWTALSVTPVRPSFMGDGDCELIQEMKSLITQNFTLRDVDYRTDCFPHEITLNGFSVKGQALRPLSTGSNALKG